MYTTSVGGCYYKGPEKGKKLSPARTRGIGATRLTVWIVLVAVGVVFGAMMNAYAMNKEDTLGQVEPTVVEPAYIAHPVKQGETLWSIAKVHLPEGMDIRAYIHEIKAMNHMETSMLREGQLLQIPIIR